MRYTSFVRKHCFPLKSRLAEGFTAVLLIVSLPGICASQPLEQSSRQQINTLVIHEASHTLDALAQRKKWKDPQFKLNVFMPAAVSGIPHCTVPPKITSAPYEEKNLSHMNYSVTCSGQAPWKINVTVKPDIYVPVAMPKEEIERGQILDPSLLMMRKYNVSNQHGDLIFKPEDVTGMTAKRTLSAFKPITLAQLQQPLLVKRDQDVTIISQIGDITAQTSGIALKNGHKGDVIKVRNANSQRVVSAAVEDTGIVKAITATEGME